MFLADTLSRPTDQPGHSLAVIATFYKLKACCLMILCYKCYTKLRCGWRESKSDMPESIHAYFDFRDELTVQDQLVQRRSLSGSCCHSQGNDGSYTCNSTHWHRGLHQESRDSMYWLRMTMGFKKYISKCDICLAHPASPGKEPLFHMSLWGVCGLRLVLTCELQERTLLVVCDYSNFIEVERINKNTTHGVMKALKTMSTRYSTPDVLISDNGLQFDSTEFATFPKTRKFQHRTPSPRYPQSNGKAENAVKTDK